MTKKYTYTKEKKEYMRKRYQENREKFTQKARDYYCQNKEKAALRYKSWYQRNRDKRLAYIKEYRRQHKPWLSTEHKIYAKNYREKNRLKLALQIKNWNQKNRDKLLCYFKQYNIINRGKRSIQAKEYYKKNRVVRIASSRKYIQENPERRSAYMKIYYQKPNVKMGRLLRNRLNRALKEKQSLKVGNTFNLLGTDIQGIKRHLEKQFQSGMTWDNRGFYTWHIDHIKPLASFDLTKPEEQRKAFHYTNLQPLWMKDNLSKGARII